MGQSIPQSGVWTLADLVDLLGPIPAHRIRHSPPPGAATQQDVIRLDRQEQRLYELVEGVLVEKAKGFYESYLAGVLVKLIGNYLRSQQPGYCHAARRDGVFEAWPGAHSGRGLHILGAFAWPRHPQGADP